jgi:hypothetical protein
MESISDLNNIATDALPSQPPRPRPALPFSEHPLEFPSVSFIAPASLPPTLVLSLARPTSNFEILRRYSAPALQAFLKRMTSLFRKYQNAPTSFIQMYADQTYRIESLEIQLETARNQTLPPAPAVIDESHPQLVLARNERDDALAQLALARTEVATAQDRIVQLETALLAAQTAPPPPPPTQEPTPIAPTDSASNIRSEMLIHPNVTEMQLIILSLAMNVTYDQYHISSPNSNFGSRPDAQSLIDLCSDYVTFRSSQTNLIHAKNSGYFPYFDPVGNDNALPRPAAQVEAVNNNMELLFMRIVNAHNDTERTAIKNRRHTTCTHGPFCIIRHATNVGNASVRRRMEIRSLCAAFYVTTIATELSPRRYPITTMQLMTMVTSSSIMKTITDVIFRSQDDE